MCVHGGVEWNLASPASWIQAVHEAGSLSDCPQWEANLARSGASHLQGGPMNSEI